MEPRWTPLSGRTDRRDKYPLEISVVGGVGVNDDSGGTVLLGDVGLNAAENFCHSGR